MNDAGLYIHIPFCASKCPYCSFYSITDYSDIGRYLEYCIDEIKQNEAVFSTIYIGGGTPSSIPPVLLGNFLEKLMKTVKYAGGEFTLEANPESVTTDFVDIVKNSPINRLSMGIQSIDNSVLKIAGRIHSAEKALSAFEKLRQTSCKVNIDMIYDIPGIEFERIFNTAEYFVQLKPEHISAYSYMPDTGYLTDKMSEQPDQTELIASFFNSNGYPRYEISNFATHENEAVHNKKYWQMKDYFGVGAGAHSMLHFIDYDRILKRKRNAHPQDIYKYMKGLGDESEIISGEALVKESVVFGLRMLNGINLVEIESKFGKISAELMAKINFLKQNGMLEYDGSLLKPSLKGVNLLDSVMEYLW